MSRYLITARVYGADCAEQDGQGWVYAENEEAAAERFYDLAEPGWQVVYVEKLAD